MPHRKQTTLALEIGDALKRDLPKGKMAKQLRQFPMEDKRKKTKEEEIPSNIPHDVIIDAVLARLPVKCLFRFSLVCKLWFNSIIHQPYLVSSHLLHSQKHPTLIFAYLVKKAGFTPSILGKNSTIHLFSCLLLDHKPDDHHHINGGDGLINHDIGEIATITTSSIRHVIGFCNGLVCFRKGSTLEVCNPSRREVLSITSPPNHILRSTSGFGFGFDPLTNEYKVVSITKDYKCIIFTLGTSSWREISGPNPVPRRGIRQIDLSTLCNGVLYWKTMALPPEIVAFDLHSEEFQVIQIPFDYKFNKEYYHLEYKGSLCLARLQRPENYQDNCIAQLQILSDRTNQVWVEENICLPFQYPVINHTIRFAGFSDQVFVCWLELLRFRLYNLNSKNLVEVKRPNRELGLDYHLTSHVENFLSLRTLMQDAGNFCRFTSLNAYFDDQDLIFKV